MTYILAAKLFAPPTLVDLFEIATARYSEPVADEQTITAEDFLQATKTVMPDKAPGRDGAYNRCLK